MIANTSKSILGLLCLLCPLSFSQDQRPTQEPPLLTFADLQKSDSIDGPFRIEAFIIQTYKCPPCPKGAMCKPCIGDYIVLSDKVDEQVPEQIKRLRVFTDKPDQFEMKKKYSFILKVKGKIAPGHPIEEVELISFDSLKVSPQN
jgi:hypothetical protein